LRTVFRLRLRHGRPRRRGPRPAGRCGGYRSRVPHLCVPAADRAPDWIAAGPRQAQSRMKTHQIGLVALAFACAVGLASAQRAVNRVMLCENPRIITADGAPIDNGALLVENDTIARVGRKGTIAAPANAAHVDLTGKTIMPGMVL